MAMLTHSYSSDLRVDLKDWDDVNFQTVYSDFMVDEQRWEYKLRYSQWLGPGADSLQHHRDGTFSTKDQGNFKSTAKFYHTGWWFVEASRWVNLNGKYYNTKVHNVAGNKWWGWRLSVTVKETKMMIRRNGKGTHKTKNPLVIKNLRRFRVKSSWHYIISYVYVDRFFREPVRLHKCHHVDFTISETSNMLAFLYSTNVIQFSQIDILNKS
jgi:hypothetical protein